MEALLTGRANGKEIESQVTATQCVFSILEIALRKGQKREKEKKKLCKHFVLCDYFILRCEMLLPADFFFFFRKSGIQDRIKYFGSFSVFWSVKIKR